MYDIVVPWGLTRGEFWDYDVTDEEIAIEPPIVEKETFQEAFCKQWRLGLIL